MTNLERANKFIYDHQNEVNPRFRGVYHAMPQINWSNDPNGFCYFKGEYHLFYQHYPFENKWGPMHWGHAVSKDLLHWKDLPIALAPEGNDESGCWSGSALEDPRNPGTLLLYYTRHYEIPGTRRETIVLATSHDGITFKRKGVIIDQNKIPEGLSTSDFRDPKILYINNHYYLLIATQRNGEGCIAVYKGDSPDNFSYFFEMESSLMGIQAECPDYQVVDGHEILFFSAIRNGKPNKNYYCEVVIDWEEGSYKLIQEHHADLGPDFYACQCLNNDNRVLLIAWFASWQEQYPLIEMGDSWSGGFTLPRELHFEGSRLVSVPLNEFANCVNNPIRIRENEIFSKVGGGYFYLKDGDLVVSDPNNENNKIVLSLKGDVLTIERHDPYQNNSYEIKDFTNGKISFAIDKSSAELFFPNGRTFSLRYYFNSDKLKLSRGEIYFQEYHL